jgi:hypothetical protein
MKLIVLLLGITLELSAASGVPVLGSCYASADVKATIAKNAEVQVLSSRSDGDSCFAITANVDGKQVRGYVVGVELDAVQAFEQARVDLLRAFMTAPPMMNTSAPLPSPKATPDPITVSKQGA